MLPDFLRRNNKTIWYFILRKLHLWLGIGLCVPLILIGITGSILVFKSEIEELVLQKHNIATGKQHSFEKIIQAALPVAKDGFIVTMIKPSSEGKPALVRFSDANEAVIQNVLVDPVSLEILDVDMAPSPTKVISQLHSNMLLKQYGGRNIVGWLGIVMMFFGISGLILWWPRTRRWKNSFKIKKGAKGLRLHRDVHGMFGIWCYAIFMAVSFSGVYMAFPNAVEKIFQLRDLRFIPEIEKPAIDKIINIDKAVNIALAEVKNSHLLMVKIPANGRQPYKIELAHENYENETPAINVFVSQLGEILEVRNPENYSIGETFLAWQHAIHSGHGFSFVWKILLFGSGFLPILFSVTGIYMWMIKRQARLAAGN